MRLPSGGIAGAAAWPGFMEETWVLGMATIWVRPGSYFRHDDERADSYAMTDGVSDTDFEDAIGEAKAEGNLSRANVVRKIRQQRRTPSDPDGHVPDPTDRSPEAAARRIKLIVELRRPRDVIGPDRRAARYRR